MPGSSAKLPRMKRINAALLFFGIVALARAAGAGFWEQLSPEERNAAGVAQLTPEQTAALNGAVDHFTRATTEPLREQVRREAHAEARQAAEAEQKSRVIATAGLPEADTGTVVRARIVGAFDGWSGKTVFQLDNGQVWRQSNTNDSMWFPPQQDLEVEIRRNGLGWKLRLIQRGAELYVRRLK